MKINELAQTISEGIKNSFEKRGFSYNKSRREFKRKTDNAEQIFRLLYTKRKDGTVTIKPEVIVHIQVIEEIYKKIAEIESRPYLTIGNYFSKLRDYKGDASTYNGEQTKLWLIEDQKDINHLIKIIPEYLEEDILPYFNTNSNVGQVDKLLNEYPERLSVHNEMYPLRANIAIIAAKLNNNPHYEKLLKIYEKEVEDAEENYKIEFHKLKDLLATINLSKNK